MFLKSVSPLITGVTLVRPKPVHIKKYICKSVYIHRTKNKDNNVQLTELFLG